MEGIDVVNNGFIKLNRSYEAVQLCKDPNAFTLLTVIAMRARRTDEFNVENLRPGEAQIGDYQNYGMTRSEYRAAIGRLLKWKFVTTKTTNKGTIARLLDSRVYDINQTSNNHQDDQPATNQRPTSDQPTATNKKDKNVKNVKKEKNNILSRGVWNPSPSGLTDSIKVNMLSIGAEMMYCRLRDACDSGRNFSGGDFQICHDLFAIRTAAGQVTPTDVRQWRQEIIEAGLGVMYHVGGEDYIHLFNCIPNNPDLIPKDIPAHEWKTA